VFSSLIVIVSQLFVNTRLLCPFFQKTGVFLLIFPAFCSLFIISAIFTVYRGSQFLLLNTLMLNVFRAKTASASYPEALAFSLLTLEPQEPLEIEGACVTGDTLILSQGSFDCYICSCELFFMSKLFSSDFGIRYGSGR